MPVDVGLPEGKRRRTRGLRREEVAERASLSTSWYTWLEQGRDVRASEPTLRKIASALRLNEHETQYLLDLADQGPVGASRPCTLTVSRALQRVLDSLGGVPAYIMNARWDRIAWNEAVLALLGDFSADPLRERNALWRTFTNPSVRQQTENWETLAQTLLAEFHAGTVRYVDERWMNTFVGALMAASLEFRQWWPQREVLPRREKRTCFHHPVAGRLVLEHSSFQIAAHRELTLCLFTPLPEDDTPAKICDLIRMRGTVTGT